MEIDDNCKLPEAVTKEETKDEEMLEIPVLSRTKSQLGFCEVDPFDGLEQNLRQKATDLFNRELGFSHVMQILQESKKPLVGHNCILDLGFITHQFMQTMPATLDEWKAQVEHSFPVLYDTKTMSVFYGGKENYGKCDLAFLFRKMRQDKTFSNNL